MLKLKSETEFEVFCKCGAPICDNVTVKDEGSAIPRLIIAPCRQCRDNLNFAMQDADRRWLQAESRLEEEQETIRQIEELCAGRGYNPEKEGIIDWLKRRK